MGQGMKRDPELLRALLLDIEKAPADMYILSFYYEEHAEWNKDVIALHIALLKDAGLVDYHEPVRDETGMAREWIFLRLTSDGHDFLDAARNAGIWKKALAKVGDKGLGIGIDLFKELLKSLVKQELGL